MTTHGGAREGAGRPPRTEPKSRPIWCGQMAEEHREMILDRLEPIERYEALMDAIERKEKGMRINVEFSDSGLWGSTDPDAEGYDAKASADKFAELVTVQLEQEYPGAEISVENTINDRHMVDDQEDCDEAEDLGEIINQVWESWNWMVTD